ncbi:MAG: NAD(P)/FAD-dependent oxidoreductase [Candidatus Limivicinus sp.]|jgi:uncharacterized FAD-dependent dehydrogenase
MILVRGLRLSPEEDFSLLRVRAASKLRISPADISEIKLIKRSLDARKKNDIHYVCSAAVSLKTSEDRVLSRAKGRDVSEYEEFQYKIPKLSSDCRPVIVGFGPAGMFASLVLSAAGLRPIVIERGQDAVTRKAAIDAFHAGGRLDPECNVQFGEGGAGTFSDGKLNTGIKDRRMSWMLQKFHEFGAPENILYDAKPHIGTDILIDVVQNIRRAVIARGGEIHFCTKMERIIINGGRLEGIELAGQGILPCTRLILAIGHSARDSYETLHAQNIPMEPKSFSMGVRIEHLQKDIDMAQYGRERGGLPPADYSLSVHLPDGSSAYTFCMCPGGQVFAAASEEGGVVTNGMSYSKRDGENSNSALLVTLHPEDFPDKSVLGGMYWQRDIERACYALGGGNYLAPAQLAGDFLRAVPSSGPGAVKPCYRPGVIWTELHGVLPQRITGVLEKALPELGKKLKGFDSPEAVLTAPETRSSAPVRILRGADFESSVKGLYPCGEGAGYAGGISSAAVDGMRCAEAVIKSLGGEFEF